MTQLFANNAVSLLAAPIAATDTSLTVMAGYGQLFPQPTGGDFFLITLENQGASVREIIKVLGRVGDTFTVLERGQEGTVARAWSASLGNDTLIDHRVTAETMRQAMLLPTSTGGSPVSSVYDSSFTLMPPAAGKTVLVLPVPAVMNSSRVWIGGLRQKRAVDYVELSSLQLQLNIEITPDDLAEGQNIVVDFDPA